MTLSILLLGFMIGLRHAMESDHVAAVASLATNSRSTKDTVRQGLAWGLGHTATLFAIGAVVLVFETVVPATLAHTLELLVGIMLVLLGIDVLRKVVRDRIHFHTHSHDDGAVHFHAHSHAGSAIHDQAAHRHEHTDRFPLRALYVGLMHGAAGSAALIVLALQSAESVAMGLLYIAIFGIGSMIGMAMLSFAIAIPMRLSANSLTRLHNGLHGVVGIVTIAIGLHLVSQSM